MGPIWTLYGSHMGIRDPYRLQMSRLAGKVRGKSRIDWRMANFIYCPQHVILLSVNFPARLKYCKPLFCGNSCICAGSHAINKSGQSMFVPLHITGNGHLCDALHFSRQGVLHTSHIQGILDKNLSQKIEQKLLKTNYINT